jgi:hypothetical protein
MNTRAQRTARFSELIGWDVHSVPISKGPVALWSWTRGDDIPFQRIGQSCGRPACNYIAYGLRTTPNPDELLRTLLARPQFNALAKEMGRPYLQELGKVISMYRIESRKPLRVASLVGHEIARVVPLTVEDLDAEGDRAHAEDAACWEVLRSLRDVEHVDAFELPTGGSPGGAFVCAADTRALLMVTRVGGLDEAVSLFGAGAPSWATRSQ